MSETTSNLYPAPGTRVRHKSYVAPYLYGILETLTIRKDKFMGFQVEGHVVYDQPDPVGNLGITLSDALAFDPLDPDAPKIRIDLPASDVGSSQS